MERDHLLTADSHKNWSKLMWHLTGSHPKFLVLLKYFNSHRMCMWREFCQLSRIFPSEAEIFPYWFISQMSADLIIVKSLLNVLATTMLRSAMFEGYGGTRGNSDTDMPLEFQNKGASSRWSRWSLFPFWINVPMWISLFLIIPYPHNCMSTCMWGYVAP